MIMRARKRDYIMLWLNGRRDKNFLHVPVLFATVQSALTKRRFFRLNEYHLFRLVAQGESATLTR
jgi:hypothetical protein